MFLVSCGKDPTPSSPHDSLGQDGYQVSRISPDESFPQPDETANCYVIVPGDGVQFPAVKGCSDEPVGDVSEVKVLWESDGSASNQLKGSIVAAIGYQDGIIRVRAGLTQGNAVIAAFSGEGTILWSWHIWVTAAFPDSHAQQWAHGADIVMDRNLGALSAEPGLTSALGLLYQWGRKDPFPGSAATDRSLEPRSTTPWPEAISAGQLAEENLSVFARTHPMTFIKGVPATRDWYAVVPEGQWGGLWGQDGIKSISDPCPAGWQVGPADLWSHARIVNSLGTGAFGRWDSENHGVTISKTHCGADAWFPAAGLRHGDDGKLYTVGEAGYLWTRQSIGSEAVRQHFFLYSVGDNLYARAYLSLPSSRASAQSVRCVKM